jgi:multiple sugar transport system substrate-binding protein
VSIGNFYRKFLEKSRSIFAPSGKMPKIDIILFAVAAAVLLAALIGQGFGKKDKTGRTEIYISDQCEYFFGKELTSALIQEFERQNSDLRILTTAGDDADIVFFDDAGFANLAAGAGTAEAGTAEAGTTGDVSPLASLSPYILNETGADQRAVPLVYFMDLCFYNIDILTAADCIRPPKTRTEFLAAAQAVAELGKASPANTVYSLAPGLSREDPAAPRREIYPWIWADGGEVSTVAADGRTSLTRPATDTITFFARLNREGLLAPGTLEKTAAQRLQEFAGGKIAMMTASARDIPFLQHNARNVNFGITAIPAATAFSKNRLGLSGIYAGISGGSTLQDEAWAFLAFVAGKRQALYAALGAVPGIYPDVVHGEYLDEDPLLSKAWEIFEAADIVEYYPGWPGEEETGRMVWELINEEINK